MPLKLETCSDADMDRAFAVISAAFGREHPYQNTIFPDHDTEPGRKTGAERMLATKKSDPNTTFIKVVDTETDKMVALGKWNVFNGTVPDEVELEGDYWKDRDEKEYARHLFRGYLAPRRKAIKESGGRLVSLDLTTVEPDDQRRGAGRMLVKWGTAIADDLGVDTVVEATDHARPLYESEGFRVDHYHVIDLPEKWAWRDTQKFFWMVRPAKATE